MNKITNVEKLRGSIKPQVCKHFYSIIIIEEVTEKI